MSKKIITALILLAGCHATFATPQPLTNKEIATRFFEAVVNEKNYDAASKYLGKIYIEHDPQGVDGPGGLYVFIEYLRNTYPNSHVEIKRVITEGDYVIFHVHDVKVPGTRGKAIIDMFRLDHGKVVEHWDVEQDIPEKSANGNGMF